MSDILQGVTLEVMGEGDSMGPIPDTLKDWAESQQGDIRYDIAWTTLGEYLEYLEARGVSPNVASFIGAATARRNILGFEDRGPTPTELEAMQEIVREAMREGALGVASALIYTPGNFADTPELIGLARASGEYGGIYISHLRSEGNQLLEALEELITIAREADVPAEIAAVDGTGGGAGTVSSTPGRRPPAASSTDATAGTLKELKAAAEREIVIAALERNGWQITKTAATLGLADHASLLKVMKRHGLKRK